MRVVGALGRRAVKQTFRRPQLMAPILIFPTLLLAIQVGGAGRAVDLPQFPEVNGFLDFMIAGAMVQATMLAGNSSGIALALDIEMGFNDRLLAAPISRFAIVLGRLVGTAALGIVTAIWFLAIALRSGSASVVQGLFPLVFVILFLSTAFFPENLLLEPARSVAEWNPLSFVVDGVRDLVISTFSGTQFAEGIAALALLAAAGLGMSAAAMRGRLQRG